MEPKKLKIGKTTNSLVPLSEAETTINLSAADALAARELSLQWRRDREAAYIVMGWTDPYSLVEDMLARGIAAVKSDRDAIKAQYPKSL